MEDGEWWGLYPVQGRWGHYALHGDTASAEGRAGPFMNNF